MPTGRGAARSGASREGLAADGGDTHVRTPLGVAATLEHTAEFAGQYSKKKIRSEKIRHQTSDIRDLQPPSPPRAPRRRRWRPTQAATQCLPLPCSCSRSPPPPPAPLPWGTHPLGPGNQPSVACSSPEPRRPRLLPSARVMACKAYSMQIGIVAHHADRTAPQLVTVWPVLPHYSCGGAGG